MKRREFIRRSSIASAGLVAIPSFGFAGFRREPVRVGIIGTGMRGRGLLGLLLDREDVAVTAICDIEKAALKQSQEIIKVKKKGRAREFTGSENAWKELVALNDLDAVIIATPWSWHAPMAIATMKSRKYAGVEVPAALSVADCFELVRTSEDTGMPCMILENVCYRRDVMAIYNMVKQGLFGELIYAEGGYQHDLREVKFNDGKQPYGGGVEYGEKGFSESKWRTLHSEHRNGELYPTHGLGPVSKMLDINCGNRFISLSSFSTKSRGLHNHIVSQGGKDHPNAKVNWKLGDVVTTVLTTTNGENITLHHDTNLPRPYSLGFRVQGTKGIWMDINKSLHLEGTTPAHQWEDAQPFLDRFDHPLWRKFEDQAAGAGHGGMDFFVLHDFIESVKNKTQTPIDVYDAATWSAVIELSEQSIAQGGEPMEFPDFTGGKWVTRYNSFAMGTGMPQK